MRAFEYAESVFRAIAGKPPKGGKGNDRRDLGDVFTPGGGPSHVTNAWTDYRVEQVRQFRHWVYIAIDRIACKVAQQQPNVGYARQAGPRQKHLAARTKALTPLREQEFLESVDDDHPLMRLLRDPNDPDTAYDLWYEIILFLCLTGSAYLWVPRNKGGFPTALWVLPSHWVWPVVGDKSRFIDAYEIRPVEGNYLRRIYPADEIIHIKFKNPSHKIDGFSPMTAGGHWIDGQLSIDRSRWHTFRNSAFPHAAFEFDSQFKELDQDELERIEAKYFSRYAGEARAGKPYILPPGVKVRNLSVSPREMDFSASADQMRDNILALFGVPAAVAGIQKDLTYGSVRASIASFMSLTINPKTRFLGQVLTEKLARLYDPSLRVWWDDATPDDPEIVEKRILTDAALGAITPSEVRALRGREPYPHGGDDPFIPNLGLILPWNTGKPSEVINPFSDKKKPLDESDESDKVLEKDPVEKPTKDPQKDQDNE